MSAPGHIPAETYTILWISVIITMQPKIKAMACIWMSAVYAAADWTCLLVGRRQMNDNYWSRTYLKLWKKMMFLKVSCILN